MQTHRFPRRHKRKILTVLEQASERERMILILMKFSGYTRAHLEPIPLQRLFQMKNRINRRGIVPAGSPFPSIKTPIAILR